MPSRTDRLLRRLVVALVLGAMLSFAAHGASKKELPVAEGRAPTAAQISEAVAAVKADPNFATERSIKTLHWASKPSKPRGDMPAWIAWFLELFGWVASLFVWLSQFVRMLLWLIAAVLAALLAIYLIRLVRRRGLPSTAGKFIAPSHVRDLDIRPESLPDDIGGAARVLWDRGEQRAALALLYRGLLSRLVHVHGVPIRDSSTEGDCLALARAHLNEERNLYAANLVRVWLRAVYGAEQIDTSQVHGLCDGFAATLDAKAEPTGFAAGVTRQPA